MKKSWGLLLVLVLSLGAVVPLLRPGFFPMHDDTQVVRVQQMALALRDGQFPVRWVGDLGYGFGYPIFNFYATLAYYLGGLFNLIGLDALLATKLMFISGILLSGVLMYLLAREFWGEMGGVIAGTAYLYAPYHALDIYVRGAVGEFWAMAFLPLIFLGLYQIKQKKIKQGIILVSLAYAATILSHNLTAMIITPLILFIVLVLVGLSKKKKQSFMNYSLVLILVLGLTAFYWLPALTEMQFTQVFGQIGGGADWQDHFVYLDQLWASPWGFAGSAPGRLDGMSFMIGKVHLLLAAFSLMTAVWLWTKKERKLSSTILVAFGFLAMAVFFTLEQSSFLWRIIPPMAFIQYPWRFLVLATLAVSFMAGATILWFRQNPRLAYVIGGMVILILLMFNLKYFQPQTYLEVSAEDYLGEEKIKWETSKISDEYLPKDFPIPQSKEEMAWDKVVVIKGEAEIKNLMVKSHQTRFEAETGEGAEILINTAFFPGWKVWLDGEEKEPVLEGGKIKLTPPPGEHQILVHLANTSIRTLANLVSLASFFGLLSLVVIKKNN